LAKGLGINVFLTVIGVGYIYFGIFKRDIVILR